MLTVLAIPALGFVLACEARDRARGAAIGGLWVFLALVGITAAVVVPHLQS